MKAELEHSSVQVACAEVSELEAHPTSTRQGGGRRVSGSRRGRMPARRPPRAEHRRIQLHQIGPVKATAPSQKQRGREDDPGAGVAEAADTGDGGDERQQAAGRVFGAPTRPRRFLTPRPPGGSPNVYARIRRSVVIDHASTSVARDTLRQAATR
uniref:Uncharacterized protein n=1 Tax=Plectus sambesii TaxID=2011161 RepID=A0A914UIQ5_9BILA